MSIPSTFPPLEPADSIHHSILKWIKEKNIVVFSNSTGIQIFHTLGNLECSKSLDNFRVVYIDCAALPDANELMEEDLSEIEGIKLEVNSEITEAIFKLEVRHQTTFDLFKL